MKPLKALVFTLMCGWSLAPVVQAETQKQVPERLTLIFEDRLLTLDFNAHPELLQQSPQHYLMLGEQKIPVSFGASLPPSEGMAQLQTEFTTAVDPEALNKFFSTTSVISSQPAKPVELSLSGSKVRFSGRPTTGHYDINQAQLTQLINQAINRGDSYVRVPAEKAFAPVLASDELSERGIESVIAIGRSNFSGSSSARVQNILAAARKFDGLIIPEGRKFSFNHTLGSVAEADGFVEELVIKGNDTAKELGGGVCQVSTTLFRAVFSAGLPIVDRRNHSYAVPYYKPHGLDATIYLGGQDFRFSNDTPGDVAMQAFVSGDNLYFVFYGKDDGRRVALEGPFISDYRRAPEPDVIPTTELAAGELFEMAPSHDGFSAQWVRRVWRPGEEVAEETLKSYYRPWAAKIMRGMTEDEIAAQVKTELDTNVETSSEEAALDN